MEVPLGISEPFELKLDMEPLVLNIPAGVPVRGRVVSEWPLPENMKVQISAKVPGVKRGRATLSTELDEGDAFLFPRISSGQYEIRCRTEGKPWKTQLEVTHKPPEEVILRVGE